MKVVFKQHCNSKFGQSFEILLINNTLYLSKNTLFLAFQINRVQPVARYTEVKIACICW